MTQSSRIAALAAMPALLFSSTQALAIDPLQINAAPAVARVTPAAQTAPRRNSLGIFGCTADGNKQTAGAVVGGLLGGFLGNRIAGRGSRTLGTVIGGALGAAGGSALGCKLQKDDQAKAEQAMETALASGQNQSWENTQSGASGAVEVSSVQPATSLAGLKFAPGVEPWGGYEKVGATFMSSMTANLRSKPGLDGRVIGQVPAGARVWVPASVQGAPWYLISDNGVAQGYVSNALLQRTDVGTGTCKTVKQTISLPDGAPESETYQACPDKTGQWVLTRV